MSPSMESHLQRATRFPRVSGDEPLTSSLTSWKGPFSPRERG